jgi:hypothetical protein
MIELVKWYGKLKYPSESDKLLVLNVLHGRLVTINALEDIAIKNRTTHATKQIRQEKDRIIEIIAKMHVVDDWSHEDWIHICKDDYAILFNLNLNVHQYNPEEFEIANPKYY